MKLFIEVVIQTFLAFFTILFITRILGRQQISQLTFYEYINGITFGSIAATLATDVNQRTYQHFAGLIIFGLLTGLVSLIALKNRTFRKVVEGEPILVIKDGKILEKNLKKARYSMDEFNELLRQKKCITARDVEFGILEMNGDLSIVKTPEKSIVTLGDLNIQKKAESIPTEIIIGGQIIYENLRKRKITGKDLMKELKKINITKVDKVMYATVDQNGEYYIDKYEDNIKNIDFSENNEKV
ncbi:MAG: DUF421 domain-containing protein [Firmicutes bacterium]|nr:DUF421 domain-containing protein [Bacillota bacterium]